MQRVFCVKFSGDGSYVILGSDDTNLRLWKAKASEQLRVILPRERKKHEYNEAITKRYKHLPEVNHIRQANMNLLMLLVAFLCHLLPMLFHYGGASVGVNAADSSLQLSRASSIVMVIAYCAYLVFQLWTHRQLFEAQDDASNSWGLSVSFLSIILLPIVGNAAEHAGAIIFAFKNKLVPVCVIVAWILGIKMDLNLNLLETSSLALAIVTTAFTLQRKLLYGPLEIK
ncbi:hypothetical protein RJT34_17760 [Clitoria ternatea]|uniref:Sof1-like protein domain-containing protein n=1 Tax=Clitoria ternatea TaxID=43366 RepID=A0AAN9J9X4_CLITE